MIRVRLITPSVYVVSADSHEELAMTFLRFQEYYESPRFKGEYFSLDQFKSWYAEEYGSFSYAEDWSGFNVPSSVLKPFVDGSFGELSDLEKKLLAELGSANGDFYVIGSNEINDSTFLHEMRHAYFYTNKQYAEEVKVLLLSELDSLSGILIKLVEMGYHQDVLLDEAHAYLSANPDWLDSEKIQYDLKLQQNLVDIRKRYFCHDEKE